jgi:outer membrane protein TolC
MNTLMPSITGGALATAMRAGAALLVGTALMMPAEISRADSPSVPAPPQQSPPGASVESLLALAREMNPEVAARALEAEAALARVDGAGTLPDPMFRTEFKDIERTNDTYLPERSNRIEYWLEQEFPLWGKRGLRTEVARAEADGARARLRAAEIDLAARIKTVFARAYGLDQAIRLIEAQLRSLAELSELAHLRYAQGLGLQQEALAAELEWARLQTEQARLMGERRQTASRMNALLARPVASPLAAPEALPPVPAENSLVLAELIERARQSNSELQAERATITAAEQEQVLVRREWYPDLTVGVAAVDEDRRFIGYEAMIGVTVPLQWGLRQAREREAAATLGAARARREGAALRLQEELEGAYWALQSAQEIARLLRDVQLPAASLALDAAIQAYTVNRIELGRVIDSERRVREISLELLNALVEQQFRLAEIERLIGGEL